MIVATDDPRIREHAESFGTEAAMTSAERRNGTERCAEVLAVLEARASISSSTCRATRR